MPNRHLYVQIGIRVGRVVYFRNSFLKFSAQPGISIVSFYGELWKKRLITK
jgi:hypothetical protein